MKNKVILIIWKKKRKQLKIHLLSLKKSLKELKAQEVALANQQDGQPPSSRQQAAIVKNKEKFKAIFDEEVSDSDSGANRTEEYIERKQVRKIIKFIKKELIRNSEEEKRVNQAIDDMYNKRKTDLLGVYA